MEILVKIKFDSMDMESGCLDSVEISSMAKDEATLETAQRVQDLLKPHYEIYGVTLSEGESLTMRFLFQDMPYTETVSEIVENAVELHDRIIKRLTDAGYTSFTVTPVISAKYEN